MKQLPFLLMASCLLVTTGPAAPPAVPMPLDGPPQFVLVTAVNPAQKSILVSVPRQVKKFVQTFVQKKAVINGVETVVKEMIPQQISVTELVQMNWFAATAKAQDVAGNPLSAEQVFQRVKVNSAVLLVAPGLKVHPAYKSVLKSDAVVLELASSP